MSFKLITVCLFLVLACSRERSSTWSDLREEESNNEPPVNYVGPNGEPVQSARARVSEGHGFGLDDGDPAQSVEIFTGKALLVAAECFASNPTGPRTYLHLDSYLDQFALLSLFSPPGQAQGWFQSALASASEVAESWDSDGINRPKAALSGGPGPVLPDLPARLGLGGTVPGVWKLTAVRFRPRDTPMQIKIAYELDRSHANTDRSIASAHIIHSIALPESLRTQFQAAINAIPQNQLQSGCAVHNLLRYFMEKGSYFFWHANVFDTRNDMNQWVFYEAKVVKNDQTLHPVVAGPLDMMPGVAVDGDVLRIVRMTFPYQKVMNVATGELAPSSRDPLAIWSSGSKTDASLPRQGRLLVGPGDEDTTYDDLTPALRHEKAFTCGNCHVRRSGSTIVTATGKLRRVPSMVARHIGFGDGGNCPTDPFFGVPRAYLTASLSEYLMDSAGAHAFYGQQNVPSKPYISPEQCLQPRLGVTQTIVSPCTMVSFGPKMEKTVKIEVTNLGTKSVPLSFFTASADADVLSDNCQDKTLKVGGKCDITLYYDDAPTSNSATGMMMFKNQELAPFSFNSADTPNFNNSCAAPVSGPANVELSSSVVSACNYVASMWQKKVRYKIKNLEATKPLFLSMVTPASQDGGQVESNNCSGATLGHDQSCTFDLSYSMAGATNTAGALVTEMGQQFDDITFGTTQADNSCAPPAAVPWPGTVTAQTWCSPGMAMVMLTATRTSNVLPHSFPKNGGISWTPSASTDSTDCDSMPGKGIGEGCSISRMYMEPFPSNIVGTLTDFNGYYQPYNFSVGFVCGP